MRTRLLSGAFVLAVVAALCADPYAQGGGPGAPAGPRYHHYVFELYALSKTLDLPADATRGQLLDVMRGIIVGKAAYVGRFRQ